jgi:hypothetical protein
MIENIKHSQLSTEEKTRNVIQRIIKLGFNGVIKSEDFFSVLTKYGDRAVMEPFLNSIQGNLTEILTKKYTPSIEPNPEGEGKVHDDCGIENEYIKLITKKPNVAALFIPSVDTLLVQFIKENIQALDFMEKWKLLFFLIKHGKVNSELLTTNVIIPGLERFKNENSLEFVREILIDQGVCNFLPKGDVGNVLTRIFEIMKDKIYEKDFNLHKSLCRRYVEKIDQEEVSLSQSYGDYFFELSSDKIESLTAILLDPLAKQEEHKKAFLETVVNKSKQALVSFAGTGGPSADSDKVIMLLKQLSKLAGENLLYENLIENIVSKNYNYVKAIMSNYFESVDPRDWSKLQGVLNAIPSEDITQGGAIDVLLILLCKGKKKIRDTAFRRILDEISNPNIVIKSREVFKELQQNYKLDLMKSLLESLTREGFDYNHAKEHLNFLNENIKFAELNDLWTWIDTKVSTGHGLPTDIIPGIIKIIRNSTSLFEEEDKKDKLIFIVLNLLRVSVSNPTDHLASIREALLLYEDTDHRRTPAKQLRASLELLVESPEELYRNFYETEIKEKL